MKAEYNLSIKNAKADFIDWCESQNIKIFVIHHVVTWEEWDDGVGIYIFVNSNIELQNIENQKATLESKYMEFLKHNNYPFDKFPNVGFEFDSDENVKNYYEGNYFYRLR